MRKTRVLVGVAGVATLLLGLVAGVVLSGPLHALVAHASGGQVVAASASPLGQECQLYEQTVVNELGVTPQTLERANLDGVEAVIARMAAKGTITVSEQAELDALAAQLGTQPCAHLTPAAVTGVLTANPLLGQQALLAHAALQSAVAGALHLTPSALGAQLASGTSIARIAQAQHVALSAVRAAYLAAAKPLLTQAVSAGLLTQPQATLLLRMLTSATASGHYPLLGSA